MVTLQCLVFVLMLILAPASAQSPERVADHDDTSTRLDHIEAVLEAILENNKALHQKNKELERRTELLENENEILRDSVTDIQANHDVTNDVTESDTIVKVAMMQPADDVIE